MVVPSGQPGPCQGTRWRRPSRYPAVLPLEVLGICWSTQVSFWRYFGPHWCGFGSWLEHHQPENKTRVLQIHGSSRQEPKSESKECCYELGRASPICAFFTLHIYRANINIQTIYMCSMKFPTSQRTRALVSFSSSSGAWGWRNCLPLDPLGERWAEQQLQSPGLLHQRMWFLIFQGDFSGLCIFISRYCLVLTHHRLLGGNRRVN